MITRLDPTDSATAVALLEVQRRAYRVEAERIGFDGIPPLHETLEQLQACGEEFLGWRADGRIGAAISWKRLGDMADIHRLVVDPDHFRRGLGRMLVRAVQALPGVARAIVSTGALNAPARRLYEAEGFRVVATVTLAPGVDIVRFAWVAAPVAPERARP